MPESNEEAVTEDLRLALLVASEPRSVVDESVDGVDFAHSESGFTKK
jgi:hypothetical protein